MVVITHEKTQCGIICKALSNGLNQTRKPGFHQENIWGSQPSGMSDT
jgi:hypothetical protein